MNSNEYISELNRRYDRYFDIKSNSLILDERIDLFAKFKVVNTRNFITKKDVVDSYENNEYCFVKSFESFNRDDLDRFIGFLKSANAEYVKPGYGHMSTYITGVIVSNSYVEDRLGEDIRKFKYTKPYRFYLNGWSEIRLVLVDLVRRKLTVNSSASRVKKVYQLTP